MYRDKAAKNKLMEIKRFGLGGKDSCDYNEHGGIRIVDKTDSVCNEHSYINQLRK